MIIIIKIGQIVTIIIVATIKAQEEVNPEVKREEVRNIVEYKQYLFLKLMRKSVFELIN